MHCYILDCMAVDTCKFIASLGAVTKEEKGHLVYLYANYCAAVSATLSE